MLVENEDSTRLKIRQSKRRRRTAAIGLTGMASSCLFSAALLFRSTEVICAETNGGVHPAVVLAEQINGAETAILFKATSVVTDAEKQDAPKKETPKKNPTVPNKQPRVSSTILRTSFIHGIQWGDTLWDLAIQHNTTVERLAKINKIKNPDLIYAGDTLKIEKGGR